MGTLRGGDQILSELGSGGMGKVYRAEVAGKTAGLEPGCSDMRPSALRM